jgi:hypothetical protein
MMPGALFCFEPANFESRTIRNFGKITPYSDEHRKKSANDAIETHKIGRFDPKRDRAS